MSYNPHIAAARREAKRLAREDGVSHQASLDRIARLSGRADWQAFVADPVPIVTEETPEAVALPGSAPAPMETGVAEEGSRMDDLSTHPSGRRRSRPWVLATIVAAFLCLMAWMQWNSWRDGVVVSGLNAAYGDERSAATKTIIPEIATDRDAFVAAWSMPGDRRRVYLSYMDWRPVVRGPVRDAIFEVRKALGYDHVYVTGVRDHPVFRIQGVVDCRTGRLRTTGGYLADNLVMPAARRFGDPRPPVELKAASRATLCGDDVLARTRNLERISIDVATVR